MKDNLTDITIVLDESGSMNSVVTETINGFNEFLQEQKKAPGEANLTLILFDTAYEIVHSGVDVKDVPPLTNATYSPSGMTALYDAVMKAILETGQRLAAMPEAERPGKVMFVILTDGQENSSKEFARNPTAVAAKIRHQETKYSWNFVYIGANQDAFEVGGGIGIRSSMISNYVASSAGTSKAFSDVSEGMLRSRKAAGPRVSGYFDPSKS
jgi:uncharacterized protein YegL